MEAGTVLVLACAVNTLKSDLQMFPAVSLSGLRHEDKIE